jgi:pimeloyl-ACP methyl ester carboxylesterase
VASPFDHPLVSSRYFFPRPDAVDDPFWVEVPGARLACARHGPRGGRCVLHFHGNGETVSDWVGSALQARLVEAGHEIVFAEYRGYGGSTGSPAMAEMLGDARRVFDAIGRPPEEVVAYGRSAGSIYAIHLASQLPDLGGLIIESGIAEPLERVLLRVRPEDLGVSLEDLQEEAAAILDHRAKVRAYSGPTLILHAKHDAVVPVDHATRLGEASGGEVVVYDEGDHRTVWELPALLEAVTGFVNGLG